MRRRRRIGAVGGVRDQDLVALAFAAIGVIGTHHQQRGQLALGAGRRLQGNAAKPPISFEPFLQVIHQRQVALDVCLRLQGMGARRSQAGGRSPR